MKRLAFITDHWSGSNAVLKALEGLTVSPDYSLETVKLQQTESVAQAIWSLINLADIIIAYISKDANTLYYEIGLAHGAGKPVIIVTNANVSLPPDLLGQRIISVDLKKYSIENLIFRLKEAVDSSGQRQVTGYRGPREESSRSYPRASIDQAAPHDFRSLFGYENPRRSFLFENWFAHIAASVPGWEVVQGERSANHRKEASLDLVIWNSRDDGELLALGNPIGVECETSFALNTTRRQAFVRRIRESGLNAIVLATTEKVNAKNQRYFSKMLKDKGIKTIVLDRDDLIKIIDPEDLVQLFKEKLRMLLYEEGP